MGQRNGAWLWLRILEIFATSEKRTWISLPNSIWIILAPFGRSDWVWLLLLDLTWISRLFQNMFGWCARMWFNDVAPPIPEKITARQSIFSHASQIPCRTSRWLRKKSRSVTSNGFLLNFVPVKWPKSRLFPNGKVGIYQNPDLSVFSYDWSIIAILVGGLELFIFHIINR